MKKYIVSSIFIAVFISYAVIQYVYGPSTRRIPPANAVSIQPDIPPVTASVRVPALQYASGVYTGKTEDAFYGPVQVAVTISQGKIARVRFLQYPDHNGTSLFINGQAMPLLVQEAIQAQDANVDGVSGASETSAAFKRSLASALAQAKA